jgi:hypothetical protein
VEESCGHERRLSSSLTTDHWPLTTSYTVTASSYSPNTARMASEISPTVA